jgi:circadian clock protein KaiC
MQFMVDCAVSLKHEVVQGVSQRNLRIMKYRGSSFEENESPFVIGNAGLDVASMWMADHPFSRVLSRRITSGIERLDSVLGGGYYIGSSVLITGVPGTAKTTLAGSFTEAACRLGKRVVFVSYDTESAQVVRNLLSVGIDLQPFVDNGLLKVFSARSVSASAEIHFMNVKSRAKEHRASCVIVDPVSALSKTGNALTAHGVAERLLDWAKSQGITLLCTSLLDRISADSEVVSMPISTVSDTWIHLSYVIHAGERNRSLSIVKSRGTWHSNQVRELILSAHGVTLADAYTAGGEVLMGTLRWEKERAASLALSERAADAREKRVQLEVEKSELDARLNSIQREIDAKQTELQALNKSELNYEKMDKQNRLRIGELRGAGAEHPTHK